MFVLLCCCVLLVKIERQLACQPVTQHVEQCVVGYKYCYARYCCPHLVASRSHYCCDSTHHQYERYDEGKYYRLGAYGLRRHDSNLVANVVTARFADAGIYQLFLAFRRVAV